MAEHSITLLTKKEVAKMYKCSYRTIENMVKLNMLKKHKIGNLVRFRSDELPILNKISYEALS